ncbi:MAG: acyl-CoA thioesterase [Thermoleophilia bacterium]|nr:acyl-CoA thioesterase [Thermoleophilia bacterium]
MSPGRRHLPEVAGPTDARPPFRFSAGARVGFSDTDAQGIVYYGRYPPYFDIARVEYWRHLGFAAHEDPARGEFVMRAFEIEYHAPAVFDDVLEVFCRVSKLGRTSIVFEFDVVLADGTDKHLASATQTMVNVDLAERRPVPIDDRVRSIVETFESFDA